MIFIHMSHLIDNHNFHFLWVLFKVHISARCVPHGRSVSAALTGNILFLVSVSSVSLHDVFCILSGLFWSPRLTTGDLHRYRYQHTLCLHVYEYTSTSSNLQLHNTITITLGSKSKKKLRKFGHMSNFHYPIYLVSLYGQKKIWTWD